MGISREAYIVAEEYRVPRLMNDVVDVLNGVWLKSTMPLNVVA
jgi:hypothetical protein